MKKISLLLSLFVSTSLLGQFGNDDLYLRLAGAYSLGINPTSFSMASSSGSGMIYNVDLSAGKHLGGELAIGKRISHGFYGELALVHLNTFAGTSTYGTTSADIEPKFSRFGAVLTFKYCAELSSTFALAPSLGLGAFFGGKITQDDFKIEYDPAFGIQPGIEGQYKFADRFVANLGFRFRVESYKAYDSSELPIANLPSNAATLDADGLQFHLGITYILVRKNLMGRKI